MGTSLVHLGATLPWMALLTGDNTAAVASSLQRTGGLITSLALVLLVPATMRLLGRANWWAPRPLGRLCARHGISDEIQAERAGVSV